MYGKTNGASHLLLLEHSTKANGEFIIMKFAPVEDACNNPQKRTRGIVLERLNYQRLYYFWTVAKKGSIKSACEELGLAQPTISGQLTAFEKAIGAKIFRREGRKLVLTDRGWLIFKYADEIFNIGNELEGWLKGKTNERRRNLTVGICSSIDMLVVLRLLSTALDAPEASQLCCFINDAEHLLLDLRLRAYDLLFLPTLPVSAENGGVFSHLLADLEISLYAPAQAAKKYRQGFPHSVQGVPVVLPTSGSALRRSVDQWFEVQEMNPNITAEIGDSELAKSIAMRSGGLVFAPSITGPEMRQRYELESIGVVEGVEARVYALTNQRKIRNPAAARIVEVNHLQAAPSAPTERG